MKKIITLLLILSFLMGVVYTPFSYAAENNSDEIPLAQSIDGNNYYSPLTDEELKELFSLSINDVTQNALSWVQSRNSYLVIKENSKNQVSIFFNAPNIQLLAFNQLYGQFPYGFEGTTYNINDTQWLVDVGESTPNKNAMTKYGFNIKSNYYLGEYPLIDMELDGVAPGSINEAGKNLIQGTAENIAKSIWKGDVKSTLFSISESLLNRFIKTGGGFNVLGMIEQQWEDIKTFFKSVKDTSVIEAPGGETYASLRYLNASYDSHGKSRIYEFFRKYYYTYFVGAIDTTTIANPEDFIQKFSKKYSPSEVSKAKAFVKENEYKYSQIKEKVELYKKKQDFLKSHDNKKSQLPPELKKAKKPDKTEQKLYDDYNSNYAVAHSVDDLNSLFAHTPPDGKIAYNQILFTNGDKESEITVADIYIFSGLFGVTADKYGQDDNFPYIVLNAVEKQAGENSQQVISAMISLMIDAARAEGQTVSLDDSWVEGTRVMPYDINTMDEKSKEIVGVVDPRAKRWLTSYMGSMVVSQELNPAQIKGWATSNIIGLFGRISELTVWLNHLTTLDVLDDIGLSPKDMWTNGLVTVIIFALIMAFLFKLVLNVFVYVILEKGSMLHIISKFAVLILSIGILTSIAVAPGPAWNIVKKAVSTTTNLGLYANLKTNDTLDALAGDMSDPSVLYWTAYYDLWAEYNTGYSLHDAKNIIDTDSKAPEVKDIILPKIGNKEIKLWPVVLSSSFEGDGISMIDTSGLRVVDHFLAPRAEVTKGSDSYSLTMRQNENFNGAFQSTVSLSKMMNIVLIFFIVLIKVATFFWFCYNLYILFIKILEAGARRGSLSHVFKEVFSPLLAIIVIDMYASMIMFISANMAGFMGIVIMGALFVITYELLNTWRTRFYSSFPPILKPFTRGGGGAVWQKY